MLIPSPVANDLGTQPVDFYGASSPPLGQQELPVLGFAVKQQAMQRAAGSGEALTGNVRSIDLMFRFGSKYGLKSGDDNSLYRFTDVAYESRLLNSAKAIAVELLLPFQ